MFLAKRHLAHRPDLGVRFESLLDRAVQTATLERDDLGRRVRVVRDGAAAVGAEDAVHVLARGAFGRVGFLWAVDGQGGLWDDDDEGVGAPALALAVVAVVVAY